MHTGQGFGSRLKLNLIVSIDTECDKGENWNTRHPLSFSNILKGVSDRLQPIFERYSIRPTYLLSPEVIRNSNCVRIFSSLGNNVELGTHFHAEFVEPQSELNAMRTEAFQSDFLPDIEYVKQINLTNNMPLPAPHMAIIPVFPR